MAAYVWLAVGLVVVLGLYAMWAYDRRMLAQGRSVRSASDMRRDSRDAKSDAPGVRRPPRCGGRCRPDG